MKICCALLVSTAIQPMIAATADSMTLAERSGASAASPVSVSSHPGSTSHHLEKAALNGCVDAAAEYNPVNKAQAAHYLHTFKQTTEKYRDVKTLSPDQAIEVTCATLPLLRYLEASDRQRITGEAMGRLDDADQHLMRSKAAVGQLQEKSVQGSIRQQSPAHLARVEHQQQPPEELLTPAEQRDTEITGNKDGAGTLSQEPLVADRTLGHHPSANYRGITGKSSGPSATAGHGMAAPIPTDYEVVAHLVQDQQRMLGAKSIASVGSGLTPYLKSPLVKAALLNMPVIGSGLDMLEALTGNDWFSDRPLDPAQRLVAFMGILPGAPIAAGILQNTGIHLSDALKAAQWCDALGRPHTAYPVSRYNQARLPVTSKTDGFWNSQTLRVMRQTSSAAAEMKKNSLHLLAMKKESLHMPAVLHKTYASTSATYTGLRWQLARLSRW